LRNFYGIKVILAVVLPLIVLVAARWMPDLSNNAIIFAAVLAAFIGVRIPNYVLNNATPISN
jgi:hypothetical protein